MSAANFSASSTSVATVGAFSAIDGGNGKSALDAKRSVPMSSKSAVGAACGVSSGERGFGTQPYCETARRSRRGVAASKSNEPSRTPSAVSCGGAVAKTLETSVFSAALKSVFSALASLEAAFAEPLKKPWRRASIPSNQSDCGAVATPNVSANSSTLPTSERKPQYWKRRRKRSGSTPPSRAASQSISSGTSVRSLTSSRLNNARSRPLRIFSYRFPFIPIAASKTPSSVSNFCNKSPATFGPISGTPGTLSDESPTNAWKSTT